jgi:two-component system chemotaxis response regulator CheY
VSSGERIPEIKKILIVDDEKIFLSALAESLFSSAGGLQILTAEDGEAGLNILESEMVDLVVSDLKMPVMDGFEFLSRMRKTHPDTPVIVISAHIDRDIERRLGAIGVSRCLEKPSDPEDLASWILEESEKGDKAVPQ